MPWVSSSAIWVETTPGGPVTRPTALRTLLGLAETVSESPPVLPPVDPEELVPRVDDPDEAPPDVEAAVALEEAPAEPPVEDAPPDEEVPRGWVAQPHTQATIR